MNSEKKRLIIDLLLISITMAIVLVILIAVIGDKLNQFAYDQSKNIIYRVALIGICGQFGIAGLGITIVCLLRKESFTRFGLCKKNFLHSVLLSLACCVPDFINCYMQGKVHRWCPFWDVNTTPAVLSSPWFDMVIAYLITAICWGFFEGFNYVVIRDKLSELFASKYRFWDWGAFACALMCIIIHGCVGVTPDALLEMLTTIFLIYGMLIVRKETGNAWGCIFVFLVYWNAL